jgi:hypothetical protein
VKIAQLRNQNYLRCSVLNSARRTATRIPSRDFVPWRFSDAGCPHAWMVSVFRHPKTCTKADMRHLFDHFVGAQQERLRDGQAERLGCS